MRALILPVVTAFAVVAAMLYQARTPETRLCEAPPVHLGEIAGFASEETPVSEAERQVLPGDTGFVKRLYRDREGRWFQVSVVIGGRTKNSVHRPEICLPAQGYQMSAPREATVDGIPWHFVTLAHHEATSMGFAYTFFNQEGFRTASHLRRIFRDVWDRSVRGRADRWLMVTVHASSGDETAFAEFLRRLKGAME